MTRLTPPLKWHGGKHYLARRIVGLMPPHLHYVEPFAGGLAVLLARDPLDARLWLPPHKGVSELVNDLDGDLMHFWRVLQDPRLFAPFQRQAQALPLSRPLWEGARRQAPTPEDPVARALAFFVRCRMSLAGRGRAFTGITRTRLRRGMNGNVSEWLGAVEGLPAVHARLRRVLVDCRPALEVIRREDTPQTLFYCDPPYLPNTRHSPQVYGAYEMTAADHRELLTALRLCKGQVILSGYPSLLYDQALAGWDRYTFDLPNHAAGGLHKQRATEVLWCNFTPPCS